MGYGFGSRPFGDEPFGDFDWCKVVLWEEMPPEVQEQDAARGYPFKKFVEAYCPSFEYLRRYLARFRTITDPIKTRLDLLEYFAANFGIVTDQAEPEEFQRMRSQLAARWNIIKGTVDAYVVLCRVHGFEVDVIPLWWDGVAYSETPPSIYNEALTSTYTITAPLTTFATFRFNCAPMVPGSVTVRLSRLLPAPATITLTDNGDGTFTGYPNSRIDYGWGYAEVTLSGTYLGSARGTYDSVVGGCVSTCEKCNTHRLRLRITPGTIGGQDELTITEAYQRLYDKLGVLSGDGVIPVHVELEQLIVSGTVVLSIGYHYDILEADAYTADRGLRWLVP